MSKILTTQIDVDASPARVWALLTDFSAYPEWNPFIVRAEGRIEVGSRLSLRMQPVGARAVSLRPTVVEAAEGSRLRWRGRLWMRGIFDAEHDFRVEALDGGRSRLTQNERFTGLLVAVMARSLDRHTLPAFEAMNAALKLRAEQSVTASS
jgi:hypothetical protein